MVFPDSLAGRTTQNYDMYSGYVNITKDDWLFYWFFEMDNTGPSPYESPEEVPLIIWTNGGPGCSAMEGATTESGPLVLYRIKESYELATGQLSDNNYAWNKQGHVLYVDQPKGVGNSFGSGACKSSVDAGKDIVTFIQGWLQLFPEYSDNKVVISGESYGGHYVPAWANAILDHNENLTAGQSSINMRGIAIGNGCVNNTIQNSERYVTFLKENNLIPPTSNPKTTVAADVVMESYIGYSPNFYDFRVRDVKCSGCYSYNYTAWSYWFLRQDVIDALNICGGAGYDAFAGAAGGCIPMPGFDSGDNFDYSAALGRALDANVSVMFYYGKNDRACDYVGAYAMATSLPWSHASDFNAAPITSLSATAALGAAGESQQYRSPDLGTGGLYWFQIGASGHMTPLDQPPATAVALSSLLAEI